MPTISLAIRHHELDIHNAQQLHRIELETATTDTPLTPIRGATAGGDERKLRGIPALARGVGGAMNGTRPGDRTQLA